MLVYKRHVGDRGIKRIEIKEIEEAVVRDNDVNLSTDVE